MEKFVAMFFIACACACAGKEPEYTFGTTVVDSSGLEGRIFQLEPSTQKLPNLTHMQPVGEVYTNTLNIWPQNFSHGFPGVTARFEWFAIEYTGKIWIDKPGEYRFSLLSDDGSKLKIDNKLLIDNDGIHRAVATSASALLTRGTHQLKIDYFQGPRYTVALVLSIGSPGEPWRIFNTAEFKPPKDPKEWVKGKISEVRNEQDR